CSLPDALRSAAAVGGSTGGSAARGSAQRAGILLELAQCLLEAFQRVAHAALDRVFSDSSDDGDLLKGHISDVPQQKHLLLLLGELLDRQGDALADLAGNDDPLGARRRVRIGEPVAERRAAFAVVGAAVEGRMAAVLLSAEVADAEVPGDRVQPRREAGLVLELARALDQPQEGLLGHVFGP